MKCLRCSTVVANSDSSNWTVFFFLLRCQSLRREPLEFVSQVMIMRAAGLQSYAFLFLSVKFSQTENNKYHFGLVSPPLLLS